MSVQAVSNQRPRHSLSQLSFCIVTSCLLVGLSGCQKTLKAPTISTPIPTQQVISTQFSINGKIGVRTPQQNGSAFYAWTQLNDYFAIDLTGALGIGQTHVEGVPGKVTLNSAKTGLLQAETPEELLLQATGWQTPISFLVSWVQGKPASAAATTQYDDSKRLFKLSEGGWNVQFNYNDKDSLPQKMVMVQALAQGENRVTLIIQSRGDKEVIDQVNVSDSAANDGTTSNSTMNNVNTDNGKP